MVSVGKLDLRGNHFSQDGFAKLQELLCEDAFKQLDTLDLRGNEIGDRGTNFPLSSSAIPKFSAVAGRKRNS